MGEVHRVGRRAREGHALRAAAPSRRKTRTVPHGQAAGRCLSSPRRRRELRICVELLWAPGRGPGLATPAVLSSRALDSTEGGSPGQRGAEDRI